MTSLTFSLTAVKFLKFTSLTTYNANNELEKSLRTQYQGNQIIKTQTIYHYDAFGRRIAKHSETRHLTQNNDQLRQTNKTQHQHTHMLWDSDLPIQEYSDTHVYTTIYDQGSFKPVARLAWLRDELLKAANDEIKNAKREFWEDAPELIPNMQVFYYHNDQLGTPNELTNEKGEVVWLADYKAWGNTAKVVWREEQLEQLQVSSSELQPIRFQGQHFDEETGLHYNRFRYYDPDMGMFISRDPIGLRGGDNVFQYAPNPVNWIDPLGLVTREAAIKSLENDSTVQPGIPARARHGRNPSRPEEYSAQQINERWSDMYQKDIARHLKAGRMPSCPLSAPNACMSCEIGSGGWKVYGGNSPAKSYAFHCGFDGYLENRVPNRRNPAPANECFYDHSGNLVTESHKYGGCRGTPDYYPYFSTDNALDEARLSPHTDNDAGGPTGPSRTHANLAVEAAVASAKYLIDQGKKGVANTPRQFNFKK